MTINISAERLLLLTEAAHLLPKRPHPSTVWRWALQGVRGVRLETIVIGGRRYTSREALQRFADHLTGNAGELTGSAPRKPRPRALEAVERELDAAGI